MKKFTLLFMTFLVVSCSSNDDVTSIDSIIGTWKPYKEFVNNIEESLGQCQEMDRFIFTNEGVYPYVFYEFDENNSTYIIEEDSNGTWEKSSENSYTFVIEGDSFIDDLIFEENTFYVESEDTYQTTDGNGNTVEVTDIYKEVFIRIE